MSIFLICLLPALIPSCVWERVYCFQKRLLDIWVTLKHRRFKRQVFRGRELQAVLSGIICEVSVGRRSVSIPIPQYKFYGSTISTLLQLNRRYGIPLREPLGELQKMLSIDLKFEKKISAIYSSAFTHLFVISAIVWAFSIVTHKVTELERYLSIDFTIFLIQLSGGLSFWIISNRIKVAMLGWLSNTLGPMTAFHSLLSVGLSCAEVSRFSSIDSAATVLESRFADEHGRMAHLLCEWRERGTSIGGEWKALIDDIWSLGEESLSKYTAGLEMIKFVVLAVFFLGSYFVYIGHLFDRFLIE